MKRRCWTGTTYRDAFAQTVDYAARSAVYIGARTAVVDVERGTLDVSIIARSTNESHKPCPLFLQAQGIGRGPRRTVSAQTALKVHRPTVRS